ncbi:MAG: hypothetical protein QXQ79_00370 [Candidatus Nanoarchaeia archaeon]
MKLFNIKSKKADIGYSYIIMIVLGIIGIILILFILKGGLGESFGKLFSLFNQTKLE